MEVDTLVVVFHVEDDKLVVDKLSEAYKRVVVSLLVEAHK